MSELSTYASNGGRIVDTAHAVQIGKWRGFVPSDGATILAMKVNNVDLDVKATYGLEVALGGNLMFMMKEGSFIHEITFSAGQAMMING